MTLGLNRSVDPWSPRGRKHPEECILIDSDAYRVLLAEARDYRDGRSTGRSFLISGHRGAGKTTMVQSVFQQLVADRLSVEGGHPILVRLNGPSVLAKIKKQPGPTQKENQKESQAGAKFAVEQIVLGLHQALAEEVIDRMRRSSHSVTSEATVLSDSLAPEGAIEIIAQLELELNEFIEPARLRMFWKRLGLLSGGVFSTGHELFRVHPSGKQGFFELAALAMSSELHARVTGDLSDSRSRASNLNETTKLGDDGALIDLAASATSVLSGLLAGVGVTASGASPGAALVSGMVAALGALGIFKIGVQRTLTRSAGRTFNFNRKLDIASLDRDVPALVDRLRRAGIVPIFMVDELDKVDDLAVKMSVMVGQLKKLVADRAFFCFLTDRTYYESLTLGNKLRMYRPEYTYFSHRLFVVYGPQDFHGYLAQLLFEESEGERPLSLSDYVASWASGAGVEDESLDEDDDAATGGEADIQDDTGIEYLPRADDSTLRDGLILPYALLHRSQCHVLDLRRELRILFGEDGKLTSPPGRFSNARRNKLSLLMQVTVESALSRAELRERIEMQPSFLQLCLDALYYPTREWSTGAGQLRLDDEEAFGRYLIDRMKTGPRPKVAPGTTENYGSNTSSIAADVPGDDALNHQAPVGGPLEVPTKDLQLLLRSARLVAEALADPFVRDGLLSSWREYREETDVADEALDLTEVFPQLMSLMPPLDRGGMLLERDPSKQHVYNWRYSPSGDPNGDRFNPSSSAIQLSILIAAQKWREDHGSHAQTTQTRAILDAVPGYVAHCWLAPGDTESIDLGDEGLSSWLEERFRPIDAADLAVAAQMLGGVLMSLGRADVTPAGKLLPAEFLLASKFIPLVGQGDQDQFLFRFDRAGRRLPGMSEGADGSLPVAEEPGDITWESDATLIEAFESFLEFFGEVTRKGAPQAAITLERLASLRIFVSAYAPADVLRIIREPRAVGSKAAVSEEELAIIRAFASTLDYWWTHILRTMVCVQALRGIGGLHPRQSLKAVESISGQLLLKGRNGSEIMDSVGKLFESLDSHPSIPNGQMTRALAASPERGDPGIKGWNGLSSIHSLTDSDSEISVPRAWESWEFYLDGVRPGDRSLGVKEQGLDDVICAILGQGPSQCLNPDLDSMKVIHWSRALLNEHSQTVMDFARSQLNLNSRGDFPCVLVISKTNAIGANRWRPDPNAGSMVLSRAVDLNAAADSEFLRTTQFELLVIEAITLDECVETEQRAYAEFGTFRDTLLVTRERRKMVGRKFQEIELGTRTYRMTSAEVGKHSTPSSLFKFLADTLDI